jgi:formate hydrogenlyase subunit 6/NADH:ubiquinone oxidoreductase subunit I
VNIIGILRRRRATGRATVPYPAPTALPAAARGAPELIVDLCVGSGTCAEVCPTNALQIDRTPA